MTCYTYYRRMSCYEYIMYLISCDYYDREIELELGKTLLDDCDNNIDPPLTENHIDTRFDSVDNMLNQYRNTNHCSSYTTLKYGKCIKLMNNTRYYDNNVYIPPQLAETVLN